MLINSTFYITKSLIPPCQQACKKLDFLLTSRQTISEDFYAFPVSRMNSEDAELLVKTMLETLGKTSEPKIVGDISKVRELIATLDGHPRAILLVLKHLGGSIDDTQTALAQIFSFLDAQYPADRQRSLYASIELSLRTLPADTRKGIQALAVCHRGINTDSFASFTGQSLALVRDCFEQLVDCHIASWDRYNYLHLDPTLSFYLKSQLPAQQVQALQKDWASEMEKLTDSLFNDVFKNSQRTFVLTRLELPNLLAYMDWMEKRVASVAGADTDAEETVTENAVAENVVNICTKLEPLIALLDNNRVLTRLESLRNLAGETLNSWSHARFEHERMSVERLHQRGLFGEAISKARQLLELTQAELNRRNVGKESNQNVVIDEDFQFDLAMAHELVGNTLRLTGETDKAMDYLQRGRKLFSNVSERGERMAFACAMIEGVCYASKGQYEHAVHLLRICVEGFARLADKRSGAIAKGHLAACLRETAQYDEAVELYYDAIAVFQELTEPLSVASSWQSLGMLYQRMGDFHSAEEAFRQSLRIKVEQQHLPGQASSLGQLGNLYENHLRKIDEAVIFYRRALDIYLQLSDAKNQARCRSNISDSLIKLGRLEEAWHEISVVCDIIVPFGLAFQPWIALGVKYDVANKLGKIQEARQAWRSAMGHYKSYREQGGHPKTSDGLLVKRIQTLLSEQGANAKRINARSIETVLKDDAPGQNPHFLKILSGVVNNHYSEEVSSPDSGLDYYQAAEINLFMEKQNLQKSS